VLEKTYRIKVEMTCDSIVVSATKQTALSIRKYAREEGIMNDQTAMARVRTNDSFLMHSEQTADVMYSDEATMAHFGALVAMARKCGASTLICCGDEKQIQFIRRKKDFSLFSSDMPLLRVIVEHMTDSWRITGMACLAVSKFYPDGIFTYNDFRGDLEIRRIDDIDKVPVSSDAVYLTFTRQDMKACHSSGRKPAMTIGMAEGLEFRVPTVYVVRLSATSLSIFNNSEQVVVGLTRHTKNLVYCTAGNDPDLMQNRIEYARKNSHLAANFVKQKPKT